jgi:3-hydroxybutyryl-CoA dehydrogenase
LATQFQQIGILGSGTMGAGITQLCAQTGYTVLLYDIEQTFLDKALTNIRQSLQKAVEKGKFPAEKLEEALGKISTHIQLSDLADCDLIIEAVPEDLTLKQTIFRELDACCKPETILASNTSSLSITALGGATKRPQQVAGLHFFNPVPAMKLVEVIRGQRTAEGTLTALTEFSQSLGKTPVQAKDTPGFIVNRVARPFYGEALKMLGEQGSSSAMVKTIDSVMKEAGGFKMGPFELMDLIGIDVNFAVTQSVCQAYFQLSRYRPHPIQQRMVHAGLLGRKTGEGFYQYDS